MHLREALQIKRENATRPGDRYSVFLGMGATPLHLEAFLTAHLAQAMPGRAVQCATGPYGDLVEALAGPRAADAHAAAVVLEYRDLDPRLGFRRLGGWTAASLGDAAAMAERRLDRLQTQLGRFAEIRVAIALPTLPLPPILNPPRWQSAEIELRLRRLVAEFAETAARRPNVTIVSSAWLDSLSPPASRHDLTSELAADFPYTAEHASALAKALALALAPPPRLKGLITDLDDTLWRGLVGEVGGGDVTWSLDDGSHGHALFQQFLGSLADCGVLLAVASKNEPAVVDAALAREDLHLQRDRLFPVEVGWHAKSESVARILQCWNIAADAVVFVDDNPLEIAEVQTRFPEMRGFLYPTHDEAGLLKMIGELRDLFGKALVTEEDLLRLDSIRAAAGTAALLGASGEASESFLASIASELEFNFCRSPYDARVFDLLNKTNQFNLNGKRVDEGDWRQFLAARDSLLLVASYRDKFGRLGKIGVAFGKRAGDTLQVNGWVLSCRAFSRHVEHAMLGALFAETGADRVLLAYTPTNRNQPFQDFLAALGMGAEAGPAVLTRSAFEDACPTLYHRTIVTTEDRAVAAELDHG